MQRPPADTDWMAVAIALSRRARPGAAPNPNVGCLIVRNGRVVARGWTGAGGRPHAEAAALAVAGAGARGATAYVSLEPCAHESMRGPACADSLIAAGVSRVVIAAQDPDPRTDGAGIARLRAAGVEVVTDVLTADARAAMAPWWTRQVAARRNGGRDKGRRRACQRFGDAHGSDAGRCLFRSPARPAAGFSLPSAFAMG